MPWGSLAGHGLAYGSGLGLLLAAVLIIGTLVAPDFMVGDYPPAIAERYGPKSPRGRSVTRVAGVLLAAGVLALLTAAMAGLPTIAPGAGFGTALVYATIIWQSFNLFDLVVLDWLIVVRWRPAFVVLPGTEGMDAYDDMGHHLRGYVKGVVICQAAALLSAVAFAVLALLL
ncbi:hypothetical protein [Sphaerisporangium corydalis]|uniref:Nitroreductase n=1 Tax=Sphaerisporangium corydalis TaxID=1441875 RepID=A0ABV9EJ55_9ACTN|nr:hypothetical protein [Sphaerisporangium corydalis]